MTRRPPAPLALVAVAVLAALRPASASASTIDLDLHNNGPSAWTKVVDLSVDPAGAVVPTTGGPTPSPLAVAKDSYGFDAATLKVYLANGTYNQADGAHKVGDPVELIPLDFGPKGLAAGADMHFTLNLDGKYAPGNVKISLPPSVLPTLSLDGTYIPQPAPPVPQVQAIALTVAAPPAPSTPEPASLALWGTAIGLGLARLRAVRRRGPSARV